MRQCCEMCVIVKCRRCAQRSVIVRSLLVNPFGLLPFPKGFITVTVRHFYSLRCGTGPSCCPGRSSVLLHRKHSTAPHRHAAVPSRTNGRGLGTFQKSFGYRGPHSFHGAESFLRSQTVLKLVKKFPAFHGIRTFELTSVCHLSLS